MPCSPSPHSHNKYWSKVSDDAKAFIRALIQPNPDDRPTAEQALKHKWLVDAAKRQHEHDLSEGFKANWCVVAFRLPRACSSRARDWSGAD